MNSVFLQFIGFKMLGIFKDCQIDLNCRDKMHKITNPTAHSAHKTTRNMFTRATFLFFSFIYLIGTVHVNEQTWNTCM